MLELQERCRNQCFDHIIVVLADRTSLSLLGRSSCRLELCLFQVDIAPLQIDADNGLPFRAVHPQCCNNAGANLTISLDRLTGQCVVHELHGRASQVRTYVDIGTLASAIPEPIKANTAGIAKGFRVRVCGTEALALESVVAVDKTGCLLV